MRLISNLLLLVATLVLVGGCGAKDAEKREAKGGAGKTDTDDDDDDKSSCSIGFNVINGKQTSDYPSVGLLAELDDKNVIGGTCTGTWIGPNTMMTAAHCLRAGKELDIVYLAGNQITTGKTIQEAKAIIADAKAKGHQPDKVIVNAEELKHGNLKDGLIEMGVAYKDIAILIFKKDLAPATTKILNRLPEDGEDAVIVGFGLTSSSAHTAKAGEKSIKRVGKNKVVVRDELAEAFPDLLLMFGRGETTDTSGNAKDSLSGSGDSGGPIFVDGALAGVVSNGTQDGPKPSDTPVSDLAKQVDRTGDNLTVYASLDSAFAKALLDKAKKAGAQFSFGSGASSTQPGTGTGNNSPTCLTD